MARRTRYSRFMDFWTRIPGSACASASLRTRYPGFLVHTVYEQLFLIAKLFPVCDGSLTVVELAIVGELVLVD